MPAAPLPAWFPLYLLLVLAATLSPFELQCAVHPIKWSPGGVSDLVRNVLLFVPLGLALGRQPAWAVALLAAALSGGIELAQRWLPRDPGAWDVLMNTTGAVLGHRLHRVLPAPTVRLRPATLALAAGLLTATLASIPGVRPNDFSNWASYPLLVGNEASGDRPWAGGLRALAVYDRPLDPGSATATGMEPPSWREGGPELWISFAAPRAARLDGPAGATPRPEPWSAELASRLDGEGLRLAGPPWRLPEVVATHLLERLRATGQLSVWLRVRPDDLSAVGPARILSFSKDVENRNFTVGQLERDVVFRVRTPTTGDNGNRPQVRTSGDPLDLEEHTILAVFDGHRSRVHVDGTCRGEAFVAGHRGRGLLGVALPATLVAVTALAGLAGPVARPQRTARRRLGLFLLGGAGAWLLLRGAGAWSHLPDFELRAVALGILSLAAAWPLLRRIVPA